VVPATMWCLVCVRALSTRDMHTGKKGRREGVTRIKCFTLRASGAKNNKFPVVVLVNCIPSRHKTVFGELAIGVDAGLAGLG